MSSDFLILNEIILAVCYPELFEGENIISIQQAEWILGDLSKFDVYKWMVDNNWQDEIVEAFRRMYL